MQLRPLGCLKVALSEVPIGGGIAFVGSAVGSAVIVDDLYPGRYGLRAVLGCECCNLRIRTSEMSAAFELGHYG